ncbi:MAG TPA: YciI family protein [Pilimelia sp.]|nr:YciI family protein [Pilimelia sp.]
MKYMLLMHYVDLGVPEISNWSPEEIKAHIDFMQGLDKQLAGSGELVDSQGLAGPEQAKVVRARADGTPAVTDGPFPEAKEFLAGYWIVDCESPERAVEIATLASAAPGPSGIPLNMPIEVRQVMSAPGEDV